MRVEGSGLRLGTVNLTAVPCLVSPPPSHPRRYLLFALCDLLSRPVDGGRPPAIIIERDREYLPRLLLQPGKPAEEGGVHEFEEMLMLPGAMCARLPMATRADIIYAIGYKGISFC